jgi:hypothetical protein
MPVLWRETGVTACPHLPALLHSILQRFLSVSIHLDMLSEIPYPSESTRSVVGIVPSEEEPRRDAGVVRTIS